MLEREIISPYRDLFCSFLRNILANFSVSKLSSRTIDTDWVSGCPSTERGVSVFAELGNALQPFLYHFSTDLNSQMVSLQLSCQQERRKKNFYTRI